MIVGLFMANFMLLVANTLLIPFFVRIIEIRQKHLKPIVCSTVMIGIFGITYGTTSMFYCIIFGILGYVFKKLKYPPGPFLLSLVLFEKLEVNCRQALTISGGDFSIFIRGPLSITFIVLSILAFGYPVVKDKIASKRNALANTMGRRFSRKDS
jgi:putative tricarboxylic transport membrane protein